MGQLLSPSEMAIYSMHFDANTLTELAETYLKDVNGMDRRKEKTPNKQSQAVALVRHAVAKAADNFAMLVNTIRLSMKFVILVNESESLFQGIRKWQRNL